MERDIPRLRESVRAETERVKVEFCVHKIVKKLIIMAGSQNVLKAAEQRICNLSQPSIGLSWASKLSFCTAVIAALTFLALP